MKILGGILLLGALAFGGWATFIPNGIDWANQNWLGQRIIFWPLFAGGMTLMCRE